MDDQEKVGRLTELLAATSRQDRQAFEQLYRLTSGKLFGICKHMLAERSDAEDMLQEVFLTVWRKAGLFDAQRGNPITWLAMIAHNKCIDRLRVGGIERNTDALDLELLPEPEKADGIGFASEQRRLDSCLSSLELKQRTVIRTAFFEGCTYHDLADRTGVPLGTMKSWIRRGLLSLKACLEK